MAAEEDQPCPQCGNASPLGVARCECGHLFVTVQETSAFEAYPRQQASAAAYVATSSQDGMAIAGMVCGIVSILGLCVFLPLSLLGSVAGIILSAISLKSRYRKMAIAGLVCSIVSIVLSVLFIAGAVALMSTINNVSQQMK